MVGRCLLVGLALVAGPGWGEGAAGRARLSNGVVFRELTIENGVLATTSWGVEGDDRFTVRTLPPSREFVLETGSGEILSAADFRARWGGDRAEGDTPTSQVEVDLEPVRPGHPHLHLRYQAPAEGRSLRKEIEVRSSADVVRVDVESLSLPGSARGGGFGLPLYLSERWFAGLEYPAGTTLLEQGSLVCRHHPGAKSFRSKVAVLGVGTGEQPIEEAFLRYVQSHRPRSGPFLLYSSWFDRRGQDLTPASCLRTFELLRTNLLVPFGLRLDAFLVDDGYQDPHSLWRAGSHWPRGLEPLASELRQAGSNLGQWMPFNGLGLDARFGQEQGWTLARLEKKEFYYLGDARYEESLRGVIDRSIEENDLACIKHDFNVLDPTLDSPGTPPEIIREKIVDATIRLLSGTRAKRPGIFLSVTSGINLSPWWLWHADALWMGHGDYNHDWSFPQSTDRQAEMTYRDEKLYRRLHIERVPLPPSALMTHGIIRGRLDETNPPYDADDWSDYVVLTLGRGTELQELYLSPEVMEQGAWNILGQAILWAQRHAETFAHTVMVGGNPGRGEVYGYAHWSAGMGIFVYRNPSIVPCEVMLTQGERPTDLPRVDRWTPIVVYPHRERLAEMSMGRPGRLTLPGESVTVVHLHPDWPADWGEVPVGRFRLDPPAKLILPESSPRASLVPMVETIDEQTIWRARLALVGTERPVEIRLATDPVDGIRLRAGPAATRSVQRRDRWGLDRFDGWRTGLPIEAEILPTPAYPEQTRATAVMRTWSSVTSGASQSMAGEVPVWPMASQGGRESIEDHVLFESRIFTRGRKLIERVGWWWLLVLLPTSAAGVLSAWWTRGQPMLVRLAVWLLLGAGLSVVYLATPVTKGLLHLLLEEM